MSFFTLLVNPIYYTITVGSSQLTLTNNFNLYKLKDIFKLVELIWQDGVFLGTKNLKSKNYSDISLYKYEEDYIFIYYNSIIPVSIELVNEEKVKEVFNDWVIFSESSLC